MQNGGPTRAQEHQADLVIRDLLKNYNHSEESTLRQLCFCKEYSNSMQLTNEGGYSIAKILFICAAVVTAAIAWGFWAYYRKKKRQQGGDKSKHDNVKSVDKQESKEKLSKEIDSHEHKPSKEELPKSSLVTPEIPVQPQCLIINMAEHRYGGRLVLKDMKGEVKHALESDRSEGLDKLEFDKDMNEIVDIGTDVDIIQTGTPDNRECTRRGAKGEKELARTSSKSAGSLEPSKTLSFQKNTSSNSESFPPIRNPSNQSRSFFLASNPVAQKHTSQSNKPKKKRKLHKEKKKERPL